MRTKRNNGKTVLKFFVGGYEMEKNKINKQPYRCTHCGYIYEPSKGCEKNKIKPETSFDEIPEDYRCPVCKSKKAGFVPIK
jgi:rubredoxin